MKNYPIIKSNEAVVVLFTAPRHGYVLDYSNDPYKDIQYKSDWNEGVFSEVSESWFKGKGIIVLSDKERAFVRMLIENHGTSLAKQHLDDHLTKFFGNNGMWFFSDEICGSYKQLRIPFNEIFNDTTVTTELKGAPPSLKPVEERYRTSVKVITELLAENERNNGDYILSEQQVWLINELINTSQFLIDQKTPVTPSIEWKETHEVKIGGEWSQVEPVFVSEVEVFFYDPRQSPLASPAPTTGVRKSNLSMVNVNSPDYRNNEIGYLCIDDDGVLHPYDPESPMTEVKLCKNIL